MVLKPMSTADAVPWEQLLVSENLQQVLRAIIQRLDRHDGLLARSLGDKEGGGSESGDGSGRGGSSDSKSVAGAKAANEHLTVIPTEDLKNLKARLDVLENTTMDGRLEQLATQEPVKAAAVKGKTAFRLSDHVIPLTQLKARVDTCDVGILANASELDAVNDRLSSLAESVQEQLAKMVTRDEFKVLEDKHNKLQEQVDKLAKDLIERLEKRINEVQKQIDKIVPRIAKNEEAVSVAHTRIHELEAALQGVKADLETKADKVYVEEVFKELKEKLEEINVDESALCLLQNLLCLRVSARVYTCV